MSRLIRLVIFASCFAGIAIAYVGDNWLLASLFAVVVLGYLVNDPEAAFDEDVSPTRKANADVAASEQNSSKQKSETPRGTIHESNELVSELVQQGRYAILLRKLIFEGLSDQQRDAAKAILAQSMAANEAGKVQLRRFFNDDSEDSNSSLLLDVDAFHIDRFAVTNHDFYLFVKHGGYREESLWEAEIVPVIQQFVDATGTPGPKFWTNGKYHSGFATHPVVGICWYEAMAYARWVGKRLPSDPEWVRAATCPLITAEGRLMQNRYPWGDTMDLERANVWGSGIGTTSAVGKFKSGESRGGVQQMVGNVWEWMHSDFGIWDGSHQSIDSRHALKSIRGGAFDTYFANQASAQFASGEDSLARKPNIGFRCAIASEDLAPLAEKLPSSTRIKHREPRHEEAFAGATP